MSLEKLTKNDRLDWDECFMRIAHVIAKRSRDPNTQNGAVIVNNKNIVVGLGYNGFPRGVDDEKLPWSREGDFCDTKYAYVVHAEENAIYNSNANTDNCKLYCTLFPCNECAKTIIQSGIKEVVFESDKYHDEDIWVASRKLLDLAGVKYRQYQSEYSNISEDKIKLKVKKLNEGAISPSFSHEGDAGLDLTSIENVDIAPGERVKIPTGLAFEIPQNYVGLIWDRSGLAAKKGLKVGGGVIDSSYRGEVNIVLHNLSNEIVSILKGDRIAQMLIQKFERPSIEISDNLSQTQRADKGFGSTDNNSELRPISEDLMNILEQNKQKEQDGEFKSRW